MILFINFRKATTIVAAAVLTVFANTMPTATAKLGSKEAFNAKISTVAMPIVRELTGSCQDYPTKWTASVSSLYTCTDLEALDLCSDTGDYTGTKGFTANQACCTCGGGQSKLPTTYSPSDAGK